MGLTYLHCAAAVRRETVERKAGQWPRPIVWNVIVLGAVVALPAGFNKGWEYAELPLPLVVLVVVAWVMFGMNIFATIGTRRYEQMYVSSLVHHGHASCGRAFVYITGNFAVDFTTGVNQANLNWMYVHNAVGLIFTPIGLGGGVLLHSQARPTRRCTATSSP